MDFMGQLGGLLNQYASGGATDRQQARNDFDQVAGAVLPASTFTRPSTG